VKPEGTGTKVAVEELETLALELLLRDAPSLGRGAAEGGMMALAVALELAVLLAVAVRV